MMKMTTTMNKNQVMKAHESEDDDQEEEEFVHTPTDDKDDDNLESKSDEEKGMDDTTYQFDDDVDARLKEPTQTDKEVVQGEGADAEMNDAQQGNENLETTQEQVVEDAHVTISTVTKKTEVPVTSSSRSSDLASKFLNFSDIPHADAEIVSPLDVHVHHEVPRTQAPTLLTIPVSVITESSPILPKEVSNFAPPVIKKLIKESRDEVTLAKVSSQPHSTYEAASTLTEFELKKILIDKMEKSESYLAAPEHRDCYDSLKKSYDLDKDFFFSYDVYSLKRGRKDKDKDEDPSLIRPQGRDNRKRIMREIQAMMQIQPQDFDELMSTPIDFSGYILNGLKIKNLTQEILLGPAFRLLKGTRFNYVELEYDFEECYKALSEKLNWENPEGGDYPFDLSKPLPLITRGKRQRVPFEYFINNDLKYLQGGVSTMTYTTSTTKTKAAQYDLPGIEDMVPNIWSHVKVAYDKYALWGISHWRQ
ncbi:hypothetical protein Tco_0242796 [Tanacetum coccineum]